ncbi:MAG: GNAT family N-acetyltransferase [Candidatus Eisenbacteria bacterium]|nr:GNAT family N-acetyltransferase [Candidatus Eisenbacteria bacterium]
MVSGRKDYFGHLGTLGLASRLRRLSDRLYGDAARLYRETGIPMEPRWFPLLMLLAEEGEMAVVGAADRLGMTHPAVHQIAAAAARGGLIRSRKDRRDERRRLLSLTARGRRVLEELRPIREKIRKGTEEILGDAGVDLIGALARVEEALEGEDLRERIQGGAGAREAEIVSYRPAYKKHFRRLNREWLEKSFAVEPEDERILDDPSGRILRKGGEVLFARLRGEIVGTVALIRVDDGTFEIAKMAVDGAARRRGIGRALALEAIDRAKRRGARRVILFTSRRLRGALLLYRSLGFVLTSRERENRERFARPTIGMTLTLEGAPPRRGRRGGARREKEEEAEEKRG